MRIVFLLGILCLSAWNVQTATLSGFVTDRSSGESLPYASVTLSSDLPTLGALGNAEGHSAIQYIPAGDYFLKVS